jgi:hypothetical protein
MTANIRVNADATSTVLGWTAPGETLQLIAYSPEQRRTYGEIKTPDGIIGWISLVYYPTATQMIYTSTWMMQTSPVPPG